MELKATVWASTASLCVMALMLGLALLLQSTAAADSKRDKLTTTTPVVPISKSDPTVNTGRKLFELNCAHCHGDDARGDEGPDLHSITLSDARIAKRIKEGVKGEMPRFGDKLKDADIQALIDYLRAL